MQVRGSGGGGLIRMMPVAAQRMQAPTHLLDIGKNGVSVDCNRQTTAGTNQVDRVSE